MFIKSIEAEGFRNLENIIINPSKGINVICGDNAQGKTNIIECIWLFTGGRSFRGAKDGELIQFGKSLSKVSVCFNSQKRDQTIEIEIKNKSRSVKLNGVPKKYISQIIGSFRAVIFSPNHLSLIKNGPDERRSFTDSAICQIKPSYASVISKYKRILNERNMLLKDIPKHRELQDTIDIWNRQLSKEGAIIAEERFKYIKKLSLIASEFYDGISNSREKLEIEYKPDFYIDENTDKTRIEQEIGEALIKKQNDDIYLGFTSSGVHRDDLTVKINNREAKKFGSQGQQRSAVLSMKLAEAAVLGEAKGEKPIILLDDVLSELDSSRQDYLLNRLENMQVFITCCESSVRSDNIFYVSGGKIISSEEK